MYACVRACVGGHEDHRDAGRESRSTGQIDIVDPAIGKRILRFKRDHQDIKTTLSRITWIEIETTMWKIQVYTGL